ncbi:MAG: hypothetical protein ACMXYA_03645, partial [Candidatus Woesearchaeota archaeon]
MRSFITRIKNHVSYEPGEYITIILYTFIFSLIAQFYALSRFDFFDDGLLLAVFIQYMIIFLVILFLTSFIQKIVAVYIGSKIILKTSWLGLIISFFMTFLYAGFFLFFIPPGYDFEGKQKFLIGRFFRLQSHKDYAVISAVGVFILLFG